MPRVNVQLWSAVFIFLLFVLIIFRHNTTSLQCNVVHPRFNISLSESKAIAQKLTEYSRYYTFDVELYDDNDKVRVLVARLKDESSNASSRLRTLTNTSYNGTADSDRIIQEWMDMFLMELERERELVRGEYIHRPQNYCIILDDDDDLFVREDDPRLSAKSTPLYRCYMFTDEDEYVEMLNLRTCQIYIRNDDQETKSEVFHLNQIPDKINVPVYGLSDLELTNMKFSGPCSILGYATLMGEKAIISINNTRWENIYPGCFALLHIE